MVLICEFALFQLITINKPKLLIIASTNFCDFKATRKKRKKLVLANNSGFKVIGMLENQLQGLHSLVAAVIF